MTYDLTSTDVTTLARSRLRLTVGDTVERAGILPGFAAGGGRNYDDIELDTIMAAWPRLAGQAAQVALMTASAWSSIASISEGERSEAFSAQASAWAARAREWRDADAQSELGGRGTASAIGAIVRPVMPLPLRRWGERLP